MVWHLEGTPEQNAIVQDALNRSTFYFDALRPGLVLRTGSRDYIPVEWSDLSRYSERLAESRKNGTHLHIHEGDDTGHPIERRERVLGLAWYSGKVTLDTSMESDPELAKEVFLSEGAHMIDFFWMTDWHRATIWNALHPDEQDIDPNTPVTDGIDLGHGHGWFDVSDYYSWVGEGWMGLFVKAYSDVQLSIAFNHPVTDASVAEVRKALTPFFTGWRKKVVHDSHRRIKPVLYLDSVPEGMRPCKVCKPAVGS